jgi:two-component system NtrC family sensor kinase
MHQTNRSGKDVSSLINAIDGISPDCRLEDVAELFSDQKYSKLLSLPVVEDGRPVGVISRYRFMDIYLKRYARELHPARAIYGRGFCDGLAECDGSADAGQHPGA